MATPTTLPATFVSGDVLEASQLNNLRGAFRVLQVVNGVTGTLVSSSSTTLADTGLSATITPSSTSSKILVLVSQAGCGKEDNGASGLVLALLRGATNIVQFESFGGYTGAAGTSFVGSCSTTYLDSPSTTSATTYKTQLANRAAANVVRCQQASAVSTITLMEISA